MRVVNRTAISLVGAQPRIDWTRQTDGDATRGTLTVVCAKAYGFREWCRVDIHNLVADMADDEIEGEEW